LAEDDDEDQASLRVKYPSLLPKDPYLKPWVKIECGARGAREPDVKRTIVPYIQEELAGQFNLAIENVTLIAAERTFWEKALILHGIHCGFRDCGRRPGDKNLVSRHYYDTAMMGDRPEGISAVRNHALLGMVRIHKLTLFKKAWERLEEAVPGTLHLVPQAEILPDLEDDYAAMSGMMFGDPPSFDWVMQELVKLEEAINGRP
jgi:Nucleotidyl transferase AbiEii toxin, Type IV TA system